MEGNILASVGGMPITDTDVDRFIAGLGQRAAAYRSPEGRAAILEELINRKLFLMEATRGLFEAEPAFKAQLKEQKEALLISYAMEKALSSVKVTEEEIAAFYDAHKAELGGGETVNASHILVDSEEKAKEILSEKEIEILVGLGGGEYGSCAWGCDLTYDYVKINGDYRT